MRTVLIALVSAASLAGQGIAPPSAGIVRDAAGRVRPVLGIAGAFTLGERIAADALSIASAGPFAAVKTADRVLIFDGSGGEPRAFLAPEGAALFALDPSGKPARAWFPATRELMDLDSGVLSTLEIDGTLALVIRESGELEALVFRDGVLWVEAVKDGAFAGSPETVSWQPLETAPPAVLLGGGAAAWFDGAELIVRGRDGSERRARTDCAVRVIERMSENWLLLRGPDGEPPVAARLDGERIQFHRIPEEPR